MYTRVPSADGSVKLIFPTDGGVFEAAFFNVASRERPYIACVSTQVGCAVRCVFCATRQRGLVRHLTAAEIFQQIEAVAAIAFMNGALQSEFEVSFMGMGEPLANPQDVIDAIGLTAQAYPGVTRVSLSTVGPSPQILTFTPGASHAPIAVHLQISLHATEESVRRKLIPGMTESIPDLVRAGVLYSKATRDRVCLNYVLLDGINDADSDAEWLAHLDPAALYVKLSHLNAVPGLPPGVRSATPQRFEAFAERLRSAQMPFKIFRGDGLDVRASCGQLAATPVTLYTSPEFARSA